MSSEPVPHGFTSLSYIMFPTFAALQEVHHIFGNTVCLDSGDVCSPRNHTMHLIGAYQFAL